MSLPFTGLLTALPINVTTVPAAPQSPVLLFAVLIQPAALLVAYLVGRFASHLVRRRAHISISTATLTALIGLDPDYATLRQPDADRFELFLRSLWRVRLGTNAAALPRLDFAPAADGSGEVCRVTVPPSPVPVYLKGPKGSGGTELWVRVGNSTQRLEVDDAVSYVARRWPQEVRPSLRARVGAYLLYHRKRAAVPQAETD